MVGELEPMGFSIAVRLAFVVFVVRQGAVIPSVHRQVDQLFNIRGDLKLVSGAARAALPGLAWVVCLVVDLQEVVCVPR